MEIVTNNANNDDRFLQPLLLVLLLSSSPKNNENYLMFRIVIAKITSTELLEITSCRQIRLTGFTKFTKPLHA